MASQSRASLWAPGQSVQSVQFVRSDFYVPPGCFSKQFSPAAVSHALSRGSQPAVPAINSVHGPSGGEAVGQMCMTQREGAILYVLSIIQSKIILYKEEGMGRLELRTKVKWKSKSFRFNQHGDLFFRVQVNRNQTGWAWLNSPFQMPLCIC